MQSQEIVIELSNVSTSFGQHIVHERVSLEVKRAEIFALIGGSGSGKSTLLREMMLLHHPNAGKIKVLGYDFETITQAQEQALKQRWGVMFQHGGLFGSLTIHENVGLPLREHTDLPDALIDELATWKLSMVGLESGVFGLYPSELSGGMLKRASLARALALDPELLFLDEPTAGLDPISAGEIDVLILKLRDMFGLTILMVTHDLDTLWQVSDRVAVLANTKVEDLGSMLELSKSKVVSVRQFFDGARGRSAYAQEQKINHKEPMASQLDDKLLVDKLPVDKLKV
ncbi:ABC transporter ATP-binding protein [Methylotenera versatilis]|uniref:ABC transporter related protein n=1 Tax=Methylotenera versatilis (strain 301) TaxID=666681 RepID=D7DJ75_METV0|nr:ATP-binding cassette domain-containing protein [Methylotenera versatilis]ADI30110.1 ABC transporter related protein [Methylotenera versatilis 301]